jgi:hypothetical protein
MTGATSEGGTAHSSEVTQMVLLVEMNCPFFRSNTTGATSGGRTAHSLEVRRRVLLVENELPTL